MDVQHYYQIYGGTKAEFCHMLQSKIQHAQQTQQPVFAYDRMHTAEELEAALITADETLNDA